MLGATITWENGKKDNLSIYGTAGNFKPPTKPIDVGNSGTSIYFLTGVSSLLEKDVILTGDQSIQRRPIAPLLNALKNLGVQGTTLQSREYPPVKIKGPIIGGNTTIEGITSQFLSALLITTPYAMKNTLVTPIDLQEKPFGIILGDGLDIFLA